MKRNRTYVAEQLLPLLDEKRFEKVARYWVIQAKEAMQVGKVC